MSEGDILVVLSLPLEQIELDHYQSRFKSMKAEPELNRSKEAG